MTQEIIKTEAEAYYEMNKYAIEMIDRDKENVTVLSFIDGAAASTTLLACTMCRLVLV